ncbi:MAG TPA: beta-N-acetylglucosaminidase domain-containing protein, partial [Segeticoccus sp.]|uniref:beta-N-acetylglucosaminidase domain-containing protein n=1 Tax=Segeticoccus sp. TaxID=2706531 RepID=UPI002D7EA327
MRLPKLSTRFVTLLAAVPLLGLGMAAPATALGSPPGSAPAPRSAPESSAALGAPALPPVDVPPVYPVPQQLHSSGKPVRVGKHVTVVATGQSDEAAVAAVRAALKAAGAEDVSVVDSAEQVPPQDTAIYVGGPDTVPGVGDVLRSLGVADAAKLPAEGYVLATGRTGGRASVVLDGHDATGTFYAAQTLRQLLVGTGPQTEVPGIEVRDWPAYPLRGVIEGFYGTPWSHDERLDLIRFCADEGFDTWVHAPKDDPYHRAKWDEPYPDDELARLGELAAEARRVDVEFAYA